MWEWLYGEGNCVKWPVACLSTDGGRAGCTDLCFCPHARAHTHVRKHIHIKTHHIYMGTYVNTALMHTHPHIQYKLISQVNGLF